MHELKLLQSAMDENIRMWNVDMVKCKYIYKASLCTTY